MKTEYLENVAAVYIYIYIKNTINNKINLANKLSQVFYTQNILRNVQVSYVCKA